MSAAPRAAAVAALGGGRIAELPPAVADAIAAGEVIERPASAIKELLENACDAGARRIEVEVEGAGLSRIRVRDDGLGMTPAELPIAFRRHATSKLRGLEDLAALHSYGFRGEALPSLAAVAALECTSRPAAERLGARLRIGARIEPGAPPGAEPAGAPPGIEPVGAPPGTTIELRDLFARQPARLRFLPGPRSERAAIARVCGDTALARPEIALRLRLDGRELLATPGLPPERDDEAARTGSRRAALAQIWGPETAAAALSFAAEREIEAGVVLRVSGLAAPPPHGRARRDGLRLFVNGRPITPGALAHAVEGAYAELLPRGRRPLAAVFLEAPPWRVDANVHPAKATVKLADERALFSLLQRALREALLGRPALGGRAPGGAGEAMPGEVAQGPARDDDGGAMAAGMTRPPDFLRRDLVAPGGGAPGGDEADGRWRRLQRLRALGGETPPGEAGAAPDAPQPDWPQSDWPTPDPTGPDGAASGRCRDCRCCGWWGSCARPSSSPRGRRGCCWSTSTPRTSGSSTSACWRGAARRLRSSRLCWSRCWSSWGRRRRRRWRGTTRRWRRWASRWNRSASAPCACGRCRWRCWAADRWRARRGRDRAHACARRWSRSSTTSATRRRPRRGSTTPWRPAPPATARCGPG